MVVGWGMVGGDSVVSEGMVGGGDSEGVVRRW